jgi:hypothetical protein
MRTRTNEESWAESDETRLKLTYTENRGRILGRNWDKSLKSFPPCYSQSPLLTDFTPP